LDLDFFLFLVKIGALSLDEVNPEEREGDEDEEEEEKSVEVLTLNCC